MPNTIMLKGDLGMREEAFAANGNIKPGHAVVRDSNNNFTKNAAAGYNGTLQIAIEDALQGNPITTAYANAGIVFTYQPRAGDVVYVRVPAGAAAIVAGDQLQLDATGCFIKLGAGA